MKKDRIENILTVWKHILPFSKVTPCLKNVTLIVFITTIFITFLTEIDSSTEQFLIFKV